MLQAYLSSDLSNIGLSLAMMNIPWSSCLRQATLAVFCSGVLECVIFPSLSGLPVPGLSHSFARAEFPRVPLLGAQLLENIRTPVNSSPS